MLIAVMPLLLASCGDDGGAPAGDITVQAGDSSSPTVRLQAAEVGGTGDVVAGAAGTTTKLVLTSRTSTINIVASATDEESGIQSLQIWQLSPTYTTCQSENVCTNHGPGLVGAPAFDSTEPKKNPGDLDFKTTLWLVPLDLSTSGLIPPAAVSASFDLRLDAFNHVGLSTNSGTIVVEWKRS